MPWHWLTVEQWIALASLVVTIYVSRQASHIHVLVNSKMTAAIKDLAEAKAEIVELKKIVRKHERHS